MLGFGREGNAAPGHRNQSVTFSSILVMLMGRNELKIIAQERKVAVCADKLLDKLILIDNIFLSDNYNYLLIGKCKTIPPEFSCRSLNSELAGNHLTLSKVTASATRLT